MSKFNYYDSNNFYDNYNNFFHQNNNNNYYSNYNNYYSSNNSKNNNYNNINYPFNNFNNNFNPYQNQNNMFFFQNTPKNQTPTKTYKLLFWNLLCDEYSFDYKTAPNIELKYKVWDYRSKLFYQILSDKKILSDIYCFVEVDKQDDIYMMLNNISNQKLFESIYFPRPSTPLGIMLLYNRYKFKVINSYKYFLGKTVTQNFALVAILQEIEHPYNNFCVIITHLIAWDKNEKIRIKQINNLFKNLSNDINLKKLRVNKIIICGDFNTNPNSECIQHMLKNNFESVFDISKGSENDGNYTMVIDTIDEGMKKLKYDYVFVNNNIEVSNKYLPIKYFDFKLGIPNQNFPSDHIFLFTEIKFVDIADENYFDYKNIFYEEEDEDDKNSNKNNNIEGDNSKNEKNKEEDKKDEIKKDEK